MKIYNKKKFVSGMVCLILSGLLFLSAVMARRAETGNILLILALLAIGGGEIARSLSRQMARKDVYKRQASPRPSWNRPCALPAGPPPLPAPGRGPSLPCPPWPRC